MLHLAPANQNSIIKKGFHLVVFEIEVVEVKIKGFSLEYRTVVCIACGTQNLLHPQNMFTKYVLYRM